MAERPPDEGARTRGTDRAPAGGDPPHDPPTATPRWVIAFAVAAVVALVLFAALHLAGGGFRGHAGP